MRLQGIEIANLRVRFVRALFFAHDIRAEWRNCVRCVRVPKKSRRCSSGVIACRECRGGQYPSEKSIQQHYFRQYPAEVGQDLRFLADVPMPGSVAIVKTCADRAAARSCYDAFQNAATVGVGKGAALMSAAPGRGKAGGLADSIGARGMYGQGKRKRALRN